MTTLNLPNVRVTMTSGTGSRVNTLCRMRSEFYTANPMELELCGMLDAPVWIASGSMWGIKDEEGNISCYTSAILRR